MSFLKNLFSSKKKTPKFDKEFHSFIVKSSIGSSSLQKISASDIEQIHLFFSGNYSKKLSADEAHIQFFAIIESSIFTIPARIKILTIIHKLIIDLGESFANEFLVHRFLNILDAPDSKNASKRNLPPTLLEGDDWLHVNILTFYFNYLQRLANNYQIYKICIEEGRIPQSEDAKLDYKLKFMWLFKISNLLSYIIKIRFDFESAFIKYPGHRLLQDVALLLLSDCVDLYSVMSKEISDLILSYPLLTTIDLIQFHSIFVEVNSKSSEMQHFYGLKNKFDDQNSIAEPNWLRIDANTAQEIEMYAKKVELLHTSAAIMRKTLKSTDSAIHNKIPVNFTENSVQEKVKSKSFAVGKNSGNNLGQYGKSKDDGESQSQRKSKQQADQRLKTEEVFLSSKKKQEQDADDGEDDEEDKAIKQYEMLLQQQKKLEDNDEDEEGKNDNDSLEQVEVMVEEKEKQKVIQQEQQKPYTFRCERPDLEARVSSDVKISDLNKLSSHESEDMEDDTAVFERVNVRDDRAEVQKESSQQPIKQADVPQPKQIEVIQEEEEQTNQDDKNIIETAQEVCNGKQNSDHAETVEEQIIESNKLTTDSASAYVEIYKQDEKVEVNQDEAAQDNNNQRKQEEEEVQDNVIQKERSIEIVSQLENEANASDNDDVSEKLTQLRDENEGIKENEGDQAQEQEQKQEELINNQLTVDQPELHELQQEVEKVEVVEEPVVDQLDAQNELGELEGKGISAIEVADDALVVDNDDGNENQKETSNEQVQQQFDSSQPKDQCENDQSANQIRDTVPEVENIQEEHTSANQPVIGSEEYNQQREQPQKEVV